MWFKKLTGFEEKSGEYVRANLEIEGDAFISKANKKRFIFGRLEIPTLGELKRASTKGKSFQGDLSIEEIVADVNALHCDVNNKNALFQAASQFNLLEMVGPDISPDEGIDGYENDHTQGPACAIACGAGTIYRNYFVKQDSQVGQSREYQVDCLELIGKELKNDQSRLWRMQNGYAMFNQDGLLAVNKAIASLDSGQRESLKDKLKVGIQWNTEVTESKSKHTVSQVYCSALPVSYNSMESYYWESFSRLILEATYEATLHAALINLDKNESNLVYLTLVGGGAFGNEEYWILESLKMAIKKFKNIPLDVKVVSYGRSNPNLVSFLKNV